MIERWNMHPGRNWTSIKKVNSDGSILNVFKTLMSHSENQFRNLDQFGKCKRSTNPTTADTVKTGSSVEDIEGELPQKGFFRLQKTNR